MEIIHQDLPHLRINLMYAISRRLEAEPTRVKKSRSRACQTFAFAFEQRSLFKLPDHRLSFLFSCPISPASKPSLHVIGRSGKVLARSPSFAITSLHLHFFTTDNSASPQDAVSWRTRRNAARIYSISTIRGAVTTPHSGRQPHASATYSDPGYFGTRFALSITCL
jgi:hypothetical protein